MNEKELSDKMNAIVNLYPPSWWDMNGNYERISLFHNPDMLDELYSHVGAERQHDYLDQYPPLVLSSTRELDSLIKSIRKGGKCKRGHWAELRESNNPIDKYVVDLLDKGEFFA